MYQRMEKVSRKLDWLGLTHNSGYAPMLRRIAGSDDISALRVLADVVEPVKDYNRGDQAATEPTSADPLNRLVDAARPESLTARRFAEQVDQVLSGKALGNAVKAIVAGAPPSPDRSAAIRKCREARMDANSAITHAGKY